MAKTSPSVSYGFRHNTVFRSRELPFLYKKFARSFPSPSLGNRIMRLLRIGAQNEGAAVGELDVRDLQLGPLAGDDRPVLRPVELERLAGQERQRHECAASGGLWLAMSGRLPLPREGRHAVAGAVVTQRDQIGVHLLDRALLLARLARLLPQHVRQLVGERIKAAWPIGRVELRHDAVRAQIFTHRVPRQPRAPRDLPDREIPPKSPASDDAQ